MNDVDDKACSTCESLRGEKKERPVNNTNMRGPGVAKAGSGPRTISGVSKYKKWWSWYFIGEGIGPLLENYIRLWRVSLLWLWTHKFLFLYKVVILFELWIHLTNKNYKELLQKGLASPKKLFEGYWNTIYFWGDKMIVYSYFC